MKAGNYQMATLVENRTSTQMNTTKTLQICMELHTCHQSSFLIRNINWFVKPQSVSQPIFGRPILEALEQDPSSINLTLKLGVMKKGSRS